MSHYHRSWVELIERWPHSFIAVFLSFFRTLCAQSTGHAWDICHTCGDSARFASRVCVLNVYLRCISSVDNGILRLFAAVWKFVFHGGRFDLNLPLHRGTNREASWQPNRTKNPWRNSYKRTFTPLPNANTPIPNISQTAIFNAAKRWNEMEYSASNNKCGKCPHISWFNQSISQ